MAIFVTVTACSAGPAVVAPQPVLGDPNNPETPHLIAMLQGATQSIVDLATSASAGEGAGSEVSHMFWATPTTRACDGNGTIAEAVTVSNGNTTTRTWQYQACQVRPGVTWNGNETLIVQATGPASRTITIDHNITATLTQGEHAGDIVTLTTNPPIAVSVTGTKSSGTVTRTLVSGTEHHVEKTAAAALVSRIDVSYDGLVITDTYAADPNVTNGYRLVTRVAGGSQNVHNLDWLVSASNTVLGLTWTVDACACAPTAGQLNHTLNWDSTPRQVQLIQTFGTCGTSTLNGSDSEASKPVHALLSICGG